jgi:hypothetical protein
MKFFFAKIAKTAFLPKSVKAEGDDKANDKELTDFVHYLAKMIGCFTATLR